MKRRDLNPGDVFVYTKYPVAPGVPGTEDPFGTVHVVYGRPSWLEGAVPSPNLDLHPKAYVCREAMNADVVLLKKPAGRVCERQSIRDQLDSAITELVELRDSI
jgi:hypothetical protein